MQIQFHNLWNTAKSELEWIFTSLNAYVKNVESSNKNDLSFHLELLENDWQIKPKESGRKEYIHITADIKKTENRHERKLKMPKVGILNRNEIDKTFARLIEKS